MGITAGLTSIREVAALFSPTRILFKSRQSPDCLLGVVAQPTDSRLSETSCSYAPNMFPFSFLEAQAQHSVLLI